MVISSLNTARIIELLSFIENCLKELRPFSTIVALIIITKVRKTRLLLISRRHVIWELIWDAST